MREDKGNLWTYPTDARIITTNGTLKKNGEAVMGRGCALEAKLRYPTLPLELGNRIKDFGNVPFGFIYDVDLITFPVKHQFWQRADIELIKQSAEEIQVVLHMLPYDTIVMPRPGCGNGGLDWNDVKPILNEILDDSFVALTYN